MTNAEVLRLSSRDKVAEALRRSLPYVPAEARKIVEGMLSPTSLAIVAGTLVAWAGSHFFGIGEIVDAVLLVVGFLTLGFTVFDGAREFYDFATLAVNASSDADLESAARHFGRAVSLLGIAAVQALLLKGQARVVAERGMPTVKPRIQVGEPPPAGNQLRLTRPSRIAGGGSGSTDAYGAIQVARNQSMTEQRLALFHELVHRYFSPRLGPLRQLRAELNMSAYARSALLRYLEEALAEGYAQLRVVGLEQAIAALRFPLEFGYVTVSQLVAEGQAIGTIVLGGTLFRVSLSLGPMPEGE